MILKFIKFKLNFFLKKKLKSDQLSYIFQYLWFYFFFIVKHVAILENADLSEFTPEKKKKGKILPNKYTWFG